MRDKLEKLYQVVINEERLTTKILSSYGFSSNDLTKFVKEGKLERVERGIYVFLDVKGLYDYGKEHEEIKIEAFKKCLELDSDYYLNVILPLFVDSIKNEEFEVGFGYLEVLFSTNNPDYMKDNNVYLCLLGRIIHLPEEWDKKLRLLQEDDVLVREDDNRFTDTKEENDNRRKILYGRRRFSLGCSAICHKVFRVFSSKLFKKQKEFDNIYIKCIMEDNIDELERLLEDNSYEGKRNSGLLNIVRDYLEMKKTRKVIEITEDKDLIPAHNYEGFLDYMNRQGSGRTPLYIMMEKIIKLKKELQSKSNTQEEIDSDVSLTDVFNGLAEDREDKFQILYNYLKRINCLDYEFLVLKLIQIALIEKDLGFTNVLMLLTNLERGTYSFNIELYASYFFEEMDLGNFELAKIYYEIIMKAKETFGLDFDTTDMENKFELCRLDREEKYLDSLFSVVTDQLRDDGGITVINNVTPRIKDLIKENLMRINDIIMIDLEDKVVLKYDAKGWCDFKKNTWLAGRALVRKDYEMARALYLQILNHNYSPKHYNFKNLGQVYACLGDKEKSLQYFMVSSYLKMHPNALIIKGGLGAKGQSATLNLEKGSSVKSEQVKKDKGNSTHNDQDNLQVEQSNMFGIKSSGELTLEEKVYLEKIIKELRDRKEVFVLPTMNSTNRRRVYDYINRISDIACFSIATSVDKQIVLRYCLPKKIRIKDIREEADWAFKTKDYKKTIELNMKLLNHVVQPYFSTFAKIGYCYMYLGNKEKAIEYFTIASFMDDSRHDYTDLIFKLRHGKVQVDPADRKTTAKVDISEFSDEKLDAKTEMVLIAVLEEGMNLLDACCSFGVRGGSAINNIRLDLAEEYFIRSQDHLALAVLREVERSEFKDRQINERLRQIRKNKNLYRARSSKLSNQDN